MNNNLGFGTRKLVSQEEQSLIQRPDVPRTKFSGSWAHKTTFNAASLIPFLVDEILPGDHMRYNVTAYVRMATPLFPLFSNQQVDTFFFFVPSRLVWENWTALMGEQINPTGQDPDDFSVPQIPSAVGGFPINTVYDYMGIPTVGQMDPAAVLSINAMPLRAYTRIYNEWFRDQNLQAVVYSPTGDGPDDPTGYTIQTRMKAHDYFTTALPWPQKFTAPVISLGTTAPVIGLGVQPELYITRGGDTPYRETGGDEPTYLDWINASEGGATFKSLFINMDGADETASPLIFADLSQATGITINQLRQGFLLQQLLERDARGGTRYTEILKSHFGVTSPDMRLQRPEYIGGGSTPLAITPIAQTAPSATDPVGTLGGAGTAAGSHSATFASTEHGWVIGLINVRSELAYQQGLHKMWTRRTRYDHYWPSLAGLGEQAILRQELYATGVDADDATVFGYQERWQEYRTRTSLITGKFKSTSTGAIDEWHLAQDFGTPPVLGYDFLKDDPPMERVLAAGVLADFQEYLADIFIRREAVRPLPMFGTPVTLGRF